MEVKRADASSAESMAASAEIDKLLLKFTRKRRASD